MGNSGRTLFCLEAPVGHVRVSGKFPRCQSSNQPAGPWALTGVKNRVRCFLAIKMLCWLVFLTVVS